MFPLWVAFVLAVALVALGVWVYRRYLRPTTGREDRYTPERILTPEQVAMLDYLRETFPDQVVLPNVPLKDMLSIRRAANRQRAAERLRTQKVDFVVCDAEGRSVFAFDVEQYHLSDAKAKSHQVKMKNRILKTAGVRFLFLKNSIHRMPSPDDFRRQLDLAALPRPKQQDNDAPESARQQLESRMSDYDRLVYPSTGFKESEVMGLSSLMGLGEDKADRKSGRSVQFDRKLEAVRRRA
jgi:intracellular sulfur oxidation DsrE/DsrF family protein